MAGYANRFVTLRFPELAEEDDYIEVVIRNPKLVAPEEFRAGAPEMAADGITPVNADAAVSAGYETMAKLVVSWHVYDATSGADEQPLLGLPATAGLVAKLPGPILERLGEELKAAFPQMPTADPAAGTSNPSPPSPSLSTTEPGPDPNPSPQN